MNLWQLVEGRACYFLFHCWRRCFRHHHRSYFEILGGCLHHWGLSLVTHDLEICRIILLNVNIFVHLSLLSGSRFRFVKDLSTILRSVSLPDLQISGIPLELNLADLITWVIQGWSWFESTIVQCPIRRVWWTILLGHPHLMCVG